MRKNKIISILGFVVMALVFSGCYEQEVADPISTEGYPVATITTDFSGTSLREGESIIFNIQLDKPIDHDLSFAPLVLEGSIGDDHDYEISGGTVSAYETSGQLVVTFSDDMLAETSEQIKFEVGVHGIGDRYLLSESQVYPAFEYSVEPPNALTINFGWDSDDDYDIVIYKDDSGYPYTNFSDNGATVANPELDASIKITDTATFYVGVMNWGTPSADYTMLLESPDGSLETMTGTFDADNLSKYYMDDWSAWGGHYYSYRVIEIISSGSGFTITKLDELTDSDYVSASTLDGAWSGYDGTYSAETDWRFNSHIKAYADGDVLTIDSLNVEWMENIWGEIFQSITPVEMIVYANGDVLIPYQDYGVTWYDANEDTEMTDDELFPYSIYGTGTYTNGELYLYYELDQAGFLVADYMFANDYCDIPYFVVGATLGKKSFDIQTSKQEIVKPKLR
ncbi:MAG: hypothetical protein PF517_11945 [Salinivirgaceae bacterium]|jgi:hypothetical protein|nr:hypothetical protein [Salinivirgaceae bacterium]